MRLLLSIMTILCFSCLDTNLADEVNWPNGPPPTARDGSPTVSHDVITDHPNIGARDGDMEPWTPDSALDDRTAPWLVPAPGCMSTEQLVGSLCSASGPQGISFRLWASEVVMATIRLETDQVIISSMSPSSEHHLVAAPLLPDSRYSVEVEVIDAAELTATEGPFEVTTTAALSPIVITEILVDPLGEEPDQELIEIFNHGAVEIELSGWTIEDEGGEDALPASSPIPPGGYALIIAGDYQPGVGGDPPPASGALMLRLDGPIGSAGLRNSGESIFLRDDSGELVSSYQIGLTPKAGVSTERIDPLAPDGDPGNWALNRNGSATPGGANSVTP